jgi:hypothetical protein
VRWRALGAALALFAPLLAVAVPANDPVARTPDDDLGAKLYLQGLMGDGRPLAGVRQDGPPASGAAAACVNCHQRSGLGGREGRNYIPPVTGRYLFRKPDRSGGDPDLPAVEGMRTARSAYTDQTLVRAIRDGIDADGKPLSYLMPRYALDDADAAALIGYLKRLDRTRVPGITATALHLATVITPDADPVKRRGMLDVLQQFVSARNVKKLGLAPRIMAPKMSPYAKTPEMAARSWDLHVWELTGPPSGWEKQLEGFMARQPVYALLSGMGRHDWAPVHEFCERARVPCLFPNVELPVDRPGDFYPLYLNRGVLLEADLIGAAILGAGGAGPGTTVQQVYRAGDTGEAAAAALADVLRARGVKVVNHALAPGSSAGAVAPGHAATDPTVLWLRPADLAALKGEPPKTVYLSGLLGGLEAAPLPPAWRSNARMAYPFDLPERRQVRVDFALGWFRMTKIPVVDAQVQVDTYLACGLLSETLSHMVDTLGPEFLIERLQSMLERRIVTGYYPHLGLGTGQRFASKGGYLVRWTQATGPRVAAEGDWTVP